MRTPALEQAWHKLIMIEGYHVKEEKGMVIRPEAAMRMYAALHTEYDVQQPVNKTYITEEEFMNMYTLKKKVFNFDGLYERIVELLHSCDPDTYNYEKDFQNDFCEILGNCYIEESEVRTLPLFNQNGVQQKYWSLDIVLNIKQKDAAITNTTSLV